MEKVKAKFAFSSLSYALSSPPPPPPPLPPFSLSPFLTDPCTTPRPLLHLRSLFLLCLSFVASKIIESFRMACESRWGPSLVVHTVTG